ncbi:MAG: DUF3307 domain-containing protein [Gemmatimonadetes bacterium]|nr:DUF3307 domain-containing protein [Gemmatimonadota bacterium]
MTAETFGLLCGLLVAHYLGDFTPLSTARMLEAKYSGGPLSPIAGHAAVHALLVALAVIVFVRSSPWLPAAIAAPIEFATHFSIDAMRARLGRRIPALRDPGQNVYWYAFGIDQLAHALVLVGLAALVL